LANVAQLFHSDSEKLSSRQAELFRTKSLATRENEFLDKVIMKKCEERNYQYFHWATQSKFIFEHSNI